MGLRIHKGFTLIELMIIVAVIAVLVAIAIPAYMDFTIRTKVSELVVTASKYRTDVANEAQQNGGVLATSGVTLTVTTGGKVTGGSITDGGVITVSGSASTLGTAVDIVLTPSMVNGIVVWACSTDSGKQKYVPAECRH